ncbi:hypothetical protein [Rhizobium sp. MHM7A]|uniref:hypothetical protein n=1 Tax=Rhizobium sp. MHM7A TaxID=2583233 RepID=UPI0011073EA6|nr:hypothetical protein [Rhizobium sp. MHM7A]TLX16646.1 hypothetical protein FFR93_04705 [Rhizobium sp. MHM7A]
MGVIVGFKAGAKDKTSSKKIDDSSTPKTLNIPTAGISYYPSYAAGDFALAQQRFHYASGLEKAKTREDRRQAAKDREAYGGLVHLDLSDPELVLEIDQIDAFVLRVTGHPHAWLAAWSYREYVRCIVTSGDLNAQEYVDQAYAAAISVG